MSDWHLPDLQVRFRPLEALTRVRKGLSSEAFCRVRASFSAEKPGSFTGFPVPPMVGIALALCERNTLAMVNSCFGLPCSPVIASGTFVATLAFAPAVIDIRNLVGFAQTEVSREISRPIEAPKGRDCGSPLAKIVAALQQARCS